MRKSEERGTASFPVNVRKGKNEQKSNIWIIDNAAVVNNSHEQITECDVMNLLSAHLSRTDQMILHVRTEGIYRKEKHTVS